ncbi:3-dehydroquinate synthase [Avrilella dinanensis]|uniref:3-dehydroquinate synthase n=1 Tax=Avrilella dinanensis TaxID=2008672 RepID=UPI00240A8A0C|nr:3-dehydroquinate synthase [Avrilella dinanensis]
MKINSLQNSSIIFGADFYESLSQYIENQNYSSLFILTDTNTYEYCLPAFLGNLATDKPIEIIQTEAGEEHKNIETCTGIWQTMTELGADRKSLLITLGGGMITDLGGFVAATFKRGIDCVNVPTSLLAMVDASVGGKTGIDLNGYKNEVGVFCFPKLVGIDTDFLATLPREEWLSGWAEMLKHGLIADYNYWRQLSDLSNVSEMDIGQLIYRSVEIKNQIVIEDFKEQHIRKTLNFGHTVGHAFESYCLNHNQTVKHGFAIAEGMIVEAYLSWKKNLISEEYLHEIHAKIRAIYPKIDFTITQKEAILDLMKHDKKNIDGKMYFVLLNGKSKSAYNQLITYDEVNEAINFYIQSQ